MAVRWGGRGFGHSSRWAKRAGAAAAVSSIAANGWSATWRSGTPPTFTPDTSPTTLAMTRAGYTNAGAVTSYSVNNIFGKRVRQVYPNSSTLSTSTVSLLKEVYSTDTVPGCTNSSALTSPKPIAAWTMPGRQVVGNTLNLELLAFHKDVSGQNPIACVIFSATDGTNTVTQTVTAMTALAGPYDKFTVLGYKVALDITSLNNAAQITANAKVYPWIGGAASIQDSSTGTEAVRGGFGPLIFRKDTTLAASPYYCYVSTTGNDGTCVASTTAATALASPALTLKGALDKIRVTAGSTDGNIVRFMAGTHSTLAASTTQDANTSEVILECDPATGKAGVTISTGVANWTLNQKFVRIRNLTLNRTGAFYMFRTGVASGRIAIDNCDLTCNANDAPICDAGGTECGVWITGLTITGQTQTTLQFTSVQNVRMIRGCSNGTSSGQVRVGLACAVIGNDFSGVAIESQPTFVQDNTVVAFNRLLRCGGATGILDIDDVTDPSYTNIAIVQNVWEWISATSQVSLRLAADANSTNNMTHVCIWNNSFAGANDVGRVNLFYDTNPSAVVRTHKSISVIGNIFVQDNIKTDYFVAINSGDPTDAPLHIGNWAQMYGCEWAYNFSQFRNASGSDTQPNCFGHEYNGLKSVYSATNSPGTSALFTTNNASTWNGAVYTAGAGGGTYTLQGGSPCKAALVVPVLPLDLAGTTRPSSNDSMGAYA